MEEAGSGFAIKRSSGAAAGDGGWYASGAVETGRVLGQFGRRRGCGHWAGGSEKGEEIVLRDG